MSLMPMQDTTSGMLCDQLHRWYQQQGSFIFCLFSDQFQCEVAIMASPTGEGPVALLSVTCMLGTL